MTPLELVLSAKDATVAAFKSLLKNLTDTSKETKRTTDEQARLAKQFRESSQRAGEFSNNIGKTATSLARSADAFGLNAGALRTVDDITEVAAMGFDNLSKSAAGFNAASVGVAGAGLAIGTAIGTWLRTFPAIEEAADRAGVAVMRLFGAAVQSSQEAAAATNNWAIEQKKIAAAYEALQRQQVQGLSAEEAQKRLFPEPPKNIRQQIVDEMKAREEKTKKAIEFAQKEAEAFDAANRKAESEHKASLDRQTRDEKAYVDAVIKESCRLEKETEKVMQSITDKHALEILERFQDEQEANKANLERARESMEEMATAMIEGGRHAFDGWSDGLHEAMDIMASLGVAADSGLGKMVGLMSGTADMIAAAAQRGYMTIADLVNQASQIFQSGSVLGGAASGAMTGFAVGGPIGAGIGALAGGLIGLFGHAKKAREEMAKLRTEFLNSVGGMAGLTAKAKEAGIALDAMLNAKTAEQLKKAIGDIKAQIDLWAEGQDKIKEAMQEYGIEVSEMGPKFAQQELDKLAAKVVEQFEILKLASGDVGMVTEHMKDKVLDLVHQYQAAGLEIPEALRPVLQAMLDNGDLVDENGQAYASLEAAGIKFAESMTESMKSLMEQVKELVEVLARGFHVPVNFDINGAGGAPSPSGGGGGGGPHYHGDSGDFPGNSTGGWYPPGQSQLAWMAEAGPARSQGELAIPKGMWEEGLTQAASMGAAMALAQMPQGGGGGAVYLDGNRVGYQLSQMSKAGKFSVSASSIRGADPAALRSRS